VILEVKEIAPSYRMKFEGQLREGLPFLVFVTLNQKRRTTKIRCYQAAGSLKQVSRGRF
jgi:hypothetical protein